MDETRKGMRVLVAGGCHVEGWPLGQKFSFGKLASEKIGAESSLLAYVILRKPEMLVDYIEEHGRPDVLVLQLGNYEAPLSMKRHIRAVFRMKKKTAPERKITSYVETRGGMVPPESRFKPNLRWSITARLKQAYAMAAQLLRPPFFDADRFRALFRTMLETLDSLHIPNTVVLTPLPSPDHAVRHFRFAAGKIVHEECERAGLCCLDSFHALGYSSAHSRRIHDIYADQEHLNAYGQRLLAEALSGLLEAARSAQTAEGRLSVHGTAEENNRMFGISA